MSQCHFIHKKRPSVTLSTKNVPVSLYPRKNVPVSLYLQKTSQCHFICKKGPSVTLSTKKRPSFTLSAKKRPSVTLSAKNVPVSLYLQKKCPSVTLSAKKSQCHFIRKKSPSVSLSAKKSQCHFIRKKRPSVTLCTKKVPMSLYPQKKSQCHFIHKRCPSVTLSTKDVLVSLYPQKFPYRLAWDWTWDSKPTCSRMTDTASDTECLPHKDVLTSKLAVNSNQTSHKISISGMTFCKDWIVVLAKCEKIPARNAGGCTRTRFHSKWQVAITHPEGICSKTTKHTSTSTVPMSSLFDTFKECAFWSRIQSQTYKTIKYTVH